MSDYKEEISRREKADEILLTDKVCWCKVVWDISTI